MTQHTSPPSPPPSLEQAHTGRSPITLRAVTVGTLLVILLAAIAPYNDFVIANTFIIGGYFPLFLVLAIFAMVVLVNAPMRWLVPRWALGSGELATIVVMVLVACSVPTQGLMRYFLPMLVAPFHEGAVNARFWEAFRGAGLPDWLFPVPSIENGLNSPIVNDFYQRVRPGESIPFGRWVLPLAAWGVFFAGMFTTLVSLAVLMRRQWQTSERLPFPLAQLTASLLQEPRPGRVLNDVMGSRLFVIAVAGVFFLHGLVAMNRYQPKTFPVFKLGFDLSGIMTAEPWTYLSWYIKAGSVYFTFIGLAYFIQSRTGFSLWATFLLADIVNVQRKTMQSEIPAGAWQCQHIGSAIAFTIGFLWIGRLFWKRVGRELFRGGDGPEPSTRAPAVCAIAGICVMIGWMLLVGMSLWVALAVLFFMLLAHVVTSRVVAETGLCFVRSDTNAWYVFTDSSPSLMSQKDVFFTGVFTATGPITTRESALAYTQQGLVTASNLGMEQPRMMRRLVGLIAWSLAISVVVSATSSLWCYYTYATPISPKIQQPFLNPYGLDNRPRMDVIEPMIQRDAGRWTAKTWDVWGQISIGAGITAVLQTLALRYQGWPFLPVGYLLCSTWYIQLAWFSLFLGWLAKVVILRYGGARMYQQARPVFVGLIFGEGLAAGFWLLVSLVLSQMGMDYIPMSLLPQ